MRDIDKNIRATNYIIDLIVIYSFWFLLVLLIEPYEYYSIFYMISFFYYMIFELSIGRTLGKMVTKTKVVCNDGSKPSFVKILLRSFWRLLPIDLLSYICGTELGVHDLYSSTKLVKSID